MYVAEHRHHHDVPGDLFEEIPAEAYELPSCWAKKISVKAPESGGDELNLVFFRDAADEPA